MREDHSVVESKKAKEPVNTVVTIDPVTKQQFILVRFIKVTNIYVRYILKVH